MIFGRITSCSGSSALLVGSASACRPSIGYRQSLIVTRKGSLNTRCRQALTADGIFGADTVRAVMQCQQLLGVAADGQIGPMTKAALAAQLLQAR